MSAADNEIEDSGVEILLKDRARLDETLRTKYTRTLTIFFCDIKGFTPFTEARGDIAARAMVQRLNDIVFPAIKEFKGKLVKTIGDAIMAYFDDPVQAVKFTMVVQQRLHQGNRGRPPADRIHLRIGMNLGEVILDKGDIFGDAVNVAARIEPQAHPDDILISARLYEAVRHDRGISCRFAKKVKMKGKTQEHDLYQVIWDQDRTGEYYSEPPQTAETKPEKALRPVFAPIAVWALLALIIAGAVVLWNNHSRPAAVTMTADPYINGYSALKARDFTRAAMDFRQLLPGDPRQVEANAALSLWQRDFPRARERVREAMVKARERIYAHVMQGDLLFQSGAVQEAEEEYRQALSLLEGLDWHRAMAYNGLGRVQTAQNEIDAALKSYSEAVRLSPDDVDILTNYGVVLERAGKMDEAQGCYRMAAQINPADELAGRLLQKIREREKLAVDQANKERIDKLVTDLISQYRSQGGAKPVAAARKQGEEKHAPPYPLWLVGLEAKGDLPVREGEDDVFLELLGEELQQSGRIQLVDRQMLESLLAELRLGSSVLADQGTALTLGRLAAAHLLLNGRIYRQDGQSLITLKVVETETSKILTSLSIEQKHDESIRQAAKRIVNDILEQL